MKQKEIFIPGGLACEPEIVVTGPSKKDVIPAPAPPQGVCEPDLLLVQEFLRVRPLDFDSGCKDFELRKFRGAKILGTNIPATIEE